MNTKQFEALRKITVTWENQNDYFELTDIIRDIREDTAKEWESAQEVKDYLKSRIDEQGVIYYASAMKFLSKNDNSLNWSLGIAAEYGFECQNLNSETLATLLLQRMLMEALGEIDSEIDEIFEEEEEEEEEEE